MKNSIITLIFIFPINCGSDYESQSQDFNEVTRCIDKILEIEKRTELMFELQSEARRKAFKTKDRRDYVLCLISNLELCKQNVAEFKRIDKVLLKLILAGSDAFSVAVKMRERVKDLLYEHRWFVIDYKDEVEMESNHQ